MDKTEHKTNNAGSICNRKNVPLANDAVTEKVTNDPEIKGFVLHTSKILIAAMFLWL
jgi:hypothetical protein